MNFILAGHSDAADVGSAAAGFCSEASGPSFEAAGGHSCSGCCCGVLLSFVVLGAAEGALAAGLCCAFAAVPAGKLVPL